jgi:Coenzyme PQQ synthesis protein D (PqqD)
MELFIRSDSVVSRVIAGETLIVPISKGVGDLASIYSLNPVASAIWEAVAKPSSAQQISDRITQQFESNPAEVEQDVRVFLAEMESVGLIRNAGAATAA